MRHPGESELSLFAGGELGFLERLRIGRHVSHCATCRAQSDLFRADRERLQVGLGKLPDELDWRRLAQEMTANIRVGLEAGECVGPVRGIRHLTSWNLNGWGLGAMIAGLCMLVALGWWMRMPYSDTQSLAHALHTVWTGHGPSAEPLSSDHGVILEAGTGGIEVKQNGQSMTFVSPRSEAVTVSVSLQGSAQASYVDSDTGQVNIANVYAQ